MEEMTKESLNELYHHGIKGQKWGIRRTLEELGHKVSSSRKTKKKIKQIEKDTNAKIKKINKKITDDEKISIAKAKAKARIEAAKSGQKLSKKQRKILDKTSSISDSKEYGKSISEMTDEEITKKINRIRLEQQLEDLIKPKVPNKGPSIGKKFVNNVKERVISQSLVDAGQEVFTKWLKQYGSKKLGLDKKQAKSELELAKEESEYWSNKNKAQQQRKQYLAGLKKNETSVKQPSKKKKSKKQKSSESSSSLTTDDVTSMTMDEFMQYYTLRKK